MICIWHCKECTTPILVWLPLLQCHILHQWCGIHTSFFTVIACHHMSLTKFINIYINSKPSGLSWADGQMWLTFDSTNPWLYRFLSMYLSKLWWHYFYQLAMYFWTSVFKESFLICICDSLLNRSSFLPVCRPIVKLRSRKYSKQLGGGIIIL